MPRAVNCSKRNQDEQFALSTKPDGYPTEPTEIQDNTLIGTALTKTDLVTYIEHHNIQARLISDIGHTPTVPDAARALGVEPDQIIKTLLFLLKPSLSSDQIPTAIIVISNGERRVDRKMIANRFGISAKRVKLASAGTVLDLLGYPAGGVPPFGHRTLLPVLVDATVTELHQRFNGPIYGGGGDDHTMMELTVAALLQITQPEVLPLSKLQES